MSKETQLAWAHFGVGAGTVFGVGASFLTPIPIWGSIASVVLGAASHYVTSRIISTVQKNVDPRFEK